MTPLERSIVQACLKYLNNLPHCKAVKRIPTTWNQTGEPDIFGCINGVHFEFEIKRPGEKPTALQLRRLEEWKAAGALTGWFTSMKKLQEFIEEHPETL